MKLSLWYPVKAIISQKFGENADYYKKNFNIKAHNGVDFACVTGSKVRAAHSGVVTFTGEDGGGGVGVVVRSNDQYEIDGVTCYIKSIYWHLEKNGVLVTVGDEVKAGDLLAYSDNTGASTGPHLHFGIKPIAQGEQDWIWYNYAQNNGYNGAIDPAPYWSGYYAEDQKLWFKLLNLLLLNWAKRPK